MDVKIRRRILSTLLIIALGVAMLIVDYGVVNAETEDKAVAIKYLSPSKITIEENTDGQWSLDKKGEIYYRYFEHFYSPEVFTVIYESGRTETFTAKGGHGDSFWSSTPYESENRRITVYNSMGSNQEEQHFTVGSNNYFTFTFAGITAKIQVEIIASTKEKVADSIKFEPKADVIQVDYADSNIVYNRRLDKEQCYFYPRDGFFKDGDTLTVTKDNAETKYTYKEGYIFSDNNDNEEWIDDQFISENGGVIPIADVQISDDQDLKGREWSSDNDDCYVILSYGSAVTKVPVKVEKNDVESISIYVGEDSEQHEIKCDQKEFGEEPESRQIIDGIVVKKTDGSEVIIKYYSEWIDGGEDSESYYKEGFFDDNNNEVEAYIKHQNMKDSGQWYVYYHGVSCEIPTSHYNTSWKIKVKPTCSKEGVYEKKCVCGEVVETKEIAIDKDAHKFTKYSYNNDAKAGVDGTETAACDYGCGATDTRTKAGTALGNSGSSSGGGGYVPPVVTTQKPEISSGDGYDVTLSKDGTTAEITVKEGYEIMAVVVNGVFKGKVTRIENLKPADKVFIVVAEQSASVSPSDNDRIIKGVQNTKVWITKTSSGKGWIKLNYKKSKGFKMDYYEVYRKTGKNGKFGTEPFYTTKSNGLTGSYKNTKSLKKGTRYYYKIRGVRFIEGKAYYTQWSKTYYRIAK